MNASCTPDPEAPGTGPSREATFLVTDDMVTRHTASSVLSTPDMVRLVERTCHQLLADTDSRPSVGVHICISHRRPVRLGDEVVVSARLSPIATRRCHFEVVVSTTAGEVGRGTHDRVLLAADQG